MLDNVGMYTYAKFDQNIPSGSRDMSIFIKLTTTDWTDAHQSLLHQKCCYASQWLDNVGMHTYAKIDQNIPSGSRDILLTDRQTDSHSVYSAYMWVVQYLTCKLNCLM